MSYDNYRESLFMQNQDNAITNRKALEIILTRCEVIQERDGKYYIQYTAIADIPFNEEEVETLEEAGIIKNEQN